MSTFCMYNVLFVLFFFFFFFFNDTATTEIYTLSLHDALPILPLAALLAVKPGCRPRLIYRVHRRRTRGTDKRKGVTEADCAALLDAAHQQLAGPIVMVWDNLNVHVSEAMTSLIAARDWLTVYRLPPYAHELNPVEPVWSHLKR